MKKKLTLLIITLILISQGLAQPQESQADPGLLPGNPFYAVENFVESVEVKVAGAVGGEELKSKAIANNAQERLAEANELASRNRSQKAAEMIDKYAKQMNRSQDIAERSSDRDLSERLQNITRENEQRLEEVREKLPEEAKAGIDRAIENSRKRAEKAKGNPGRSGGKNSSVKPELPVNKSVNPGNKSEGLKPGNPGKDAKNSGEIVIDEKDSSRNNLSDSLDENLSGERGPEEEQSDENQDSDGDDEVGEPPSVPDLNQ